jgi:hypothetical protein
VLAADNLYDPFAAAISSRVQCSPLLSFTHRHLPKHTMRHAIKPQMQPALRSNLLFQRCEADPFGNR